MALFVVLLARGMRPRLGRRRHVIVKRWMMKFRWCRFVNDRHFATHGQLVGGLGRRRVAETGYVLLQLAVFVGMLLRWGLKRTDRRRPGCLHHLLECRHPRGSGWQVNRQRVWRGMDNPRFRRWGLAGGWRNRLRMRR